jgi:hypothetical protein
MIGQRNSSRMTIPWSRHFKPSLPKSFISRFWIWPATKTKSRNQATHRYHGDSTPPDRCIVVYLGPLGMRKANRGNISSRNPIQLLLAIGVFSLFGGLLYLFIQLLDNKSLLQEKLRELDHCHKELEQRDQQEILLKSDIKNLKSRIKEAPPPLSRPDSAGPKIQNQAENFLSPAGDYDLRDLLLLPKAISDHETMTEFQSKWQLTSPLYGQCGAVRSIAPPSIPPPVSSTNPCRIAIISSWFPRPCGIATHSHMLFDGIRHSCPPNSEIDIIAVRNPNEDETVFPSEVRYSFAKGSLQEYHGVAEHINRKGYHGVILGYEFGLYEDEYLLCLLRGIDISRTQIVTILHTLADNLPYQKQALTQQVR